MNDFPVKKGQTRMLDTKVVTITDPAQSMEALALAGEILRAGGLVVFPTETVYGLGGDATNADAAGKIYAAKGRPSDNPLIIHIEHPADAEKYCQTNAFYYRLAEQFMPGPLTVILPKKDTIPYSVTGGLDTVAVRCPSHPVARALIAAAGVPIAAPSANLSGKPSPTTAEHVVCDMMGRVDMVIDGGESEIGLESTIISLNGESATLLRPGAITYDALCCVCDHVEVAAAVSHRLAENERPLSPGMKYKHYAPTAPFILLDGTPEDVLQFLREHQKSEKCAILCYDEEIPHLSEEGLLPIGAKADLSAQAHSLFGALRKTDDMQVNVIYGHLPPMDGIGLALYNRMIRAAAHTVQKV